MSDRIMFSTKERLRRRTPAAGIDREEYIEHLVEEFHTTTNVGELADSFYKQ